MKRNLMLYGWHDFLEKVEQRFGTMQFEDPLADLAKLTQTGIVGDFQAMFEKFLNKVPSKTTIPAFSNSTRSTGKIVQGLLLAPKITQPSMTNTTLPIRKFSVAEIRERRDKGLCFHCDERYSPGHRCKGCFLLLIGDEDEDHLEGETINKEDNNLEGLGSVTHDYSQMTMEFIKDSKKVKLQGESVLHHPLISFNQLQAMADNGDIQAAYEIHQLSSTETKTTPLELSPIPKELPEAFQLVLLEFSSIFEPPNTLPPHRKFDHNIHLLPNTKPVNIRPYRYPYFQKYEIEKLSSDLYIIIVYLLPSSAVAVKEQGKPREEREKHLHL
nr:Transposon Ty3-G Gag-Pol polyprotein [Ipomoea batatas]